MDVHRKEEPDSMWKRILNKITKMHRILSLLAASAAWIVLSGCNFYTFGEELPPQRGEFSAEMQVDAPGQGEQESQNEVLDGETSSITIGRPMLRQAPLIEKGLDNPAGELQEACGSMMVKIGAGGLIGSGILWQESEAEILVLTAGHVLERMADQVTVVFYDGFQVQTDRVIRSETTDLAILKIPREALIEDNGQGNKDHGEACRRVSVNQDAYDRAAVGDTVIALGSYSGVAEDAYAGVLTQDYIYSEDFEAYIMLANCPVKPGMSGGGLFDEEGNLLGILCGSSKEGEVAVVPLIAILAMNK